MDYIVRKQALDRDKAKGSLATVTLNLCEATTSLTESYGQEFPSQKDMSWSIDM